MTTTNTTLTPGRYWRLRRAVVALLMISAVVLLYVSQGEGLLAQVSQDDPKSIWFFAVLLIYMLLLAIPFMPSVEIGWLIMMTFGIPGIIGAWVTTWFGLLLGFGLGRLFEPSPLYQRLLRRLNHGLEKTTEGGSTGRLNKVLQTSRRRPSLFIAVALNLPGNWVLGGGGGIAILSALVLRVSWWRFLLPVIPATGVVPLLLLLGLNPIAG